MLLYSGKRTHSYEWKELPINEEVIARVEELVEEEEAPEMKRGYPTFTWKQRIIDESDLNINDGIEDEMDINVNNDNNNIEEQGNDDIEEQDNPIPKQELQVNENDNAHEIINEEEPIEEETNYITDESSINDEDNNDNNEDGLDDVHVMDEIPEEAMPIELDNNNEEQGAIKNEEVIVEDVIEDDEYEGVEVELNENGRQRRSCVGQGVERLKMNMEITKEHASVKEQN